ncbi:jg26505 [Pararge aegeria aegeria]|uniref:Jg26505 protein n=1 Tax=Pararge aegeria aegeria TaxID=348720 RepID=A0A8S4RWS9_9NEOP|nr:jg26505 [Pararge aegeria aegeria]
MDTITFAVNSRTAKLRARGVTKSPTFSIAGQQRVDYSTSNGYFADNMMSKFRREALGSRMPVSDKFSQMKAVDQFDKDPSVGGSAVPIRKKRIISV